MKPIVLFLTVCFWAPFALTGDDIPPPPMPDYMKKHRITNPPPAPKRKPAMADRAPESEKFLKDLDADKKIYSKQEYKEPHPENIKDEFLEAVEAEDSTDTADTMEDTPLDLEQPKEESLDSLLENQNPEIVEQAPIKVEADPLEVDEREFEQANINTASEEKSVSVTEAEDSMSKSSDLEPENNLSDVEEQLEVAEQEAEKKLLQKRSPSGKTSFKPGMYKFAKKCTMYSEPSSISDESGSIKPGRKLWIDAHNKSWHKAYKKSGAVYISSDCLEN